MDKKQPNKLPVLFSIDKKLGIKGGFFYSVDCTLTRNSGTFCVNHIHGKKRKKMKGKNRNAIDDVNASCGGNGPNDGGGSSGCGGCGS